MSIRVLIADDHVVIRQRLCIYPAANADLEMPGKAADTAQARRVAHELEPDVVPIGLVMPATNGIAATGAIRRPIRFLVLEPSRDVE